MFLVRRTRLSVFGGERAHGRSKCQSRKRAAGETTPLGGIAQPDNIALAPTFLASDDARWRTGQVIVVARSERM